MHDPGWHTDFLWFSFSRVGYDEFELAVPYWFLILIFSAVLFFVWRKTRPKLNPKMAFPVEVKSQGVQRFKSEG